MQPALLFLALILPLNLQSAAPNPSSPQKSSIENPQKPSVEKKTDPKLHADAIQLVEVSGAKQRLQESFPKLIEDGRKAMMERCPTCTPAFADEWAKRMRDRVNVDDFLAVYVRVYEKYFTEQEIIELIALQRQKDGTGAATMSPALKQKLTDVMPALLGEAVGTCTQIGAKLGGQIGNEIEREHPEYFKAPTKPESH
jgi:hypothetical protein